MPLDCISQYMLSNYIKKKERWFNRDDLENDILLVNDCKQTLRKIAQTTGILRTTLSKWVNNMKLSKFGLGNFNICSRN